jgi:hypothetical protein
MKNRTKHAKAAQSIHLVFNVHHSFSPRACTTLPHHAAIHTVFLEPMECHHCEPFVVVSNGQSAHS